MLGSDSKINHGTNFKLHNQMPDHYQLFARGKCKQPYVCFFFVYANYSLIFFFSCTVTINEYGSLPSMEHIILDDAIFMLTGTMSTLLLWFKSKLMRLVMNGKWEPFAELHLPITAIVW